MDFATMGKAFRTSSFLAQLGGFLSTKWVLNFGQRLAVVIDRRGEILYAGDLAAP